MADMFDSREKVLQILGDYLANHKQTFLVEIRNWLAGDLCIWGLLQERSTPYYFNFLIDGTPAQLGVMLRHFFPNYRFTNEYGDVTVVVMKPEGRELGEIPSEINPLQVILICGRSRITILAHTMPNNQSLIRVSLIGDTESWRLWDVVRLEMEKLVWFHFPDIPFQLLEDPASNVSVPSIMPAGSVTEPWLLISVPGNNREIVRFWNAHWSCKQISGKLGGTEKTILNRINLLHKQYGRQIVPYRKSSKTKETIDEG